MTAPEGTAPGQAAYEVPGVYIRWCQLDGYNPPDEDIAAMYAGKTNAERYFWESLDECARIAAAAAAQPAPGALAAEILRAYITRIKYDETEQDRKRIEGWRERLEAAQPAPELDQLLTDVYACTRDWSAWQYGTMTEGDFTPAAETDLRADLIAWREAAAQPASGLVALVVCACAHTAARHVDNGCMEEDCCCTLPFRDMERYEQPAPAAAPEVAEVRNALAVVLGLFAKGGDGWHARISQVSLARAWKVTGEPVPDELRPFL